MEMTAEHTQGTTAGGGAAIDHYLKSVMPKVSGWLTPESARAVALLAGVQRRENVMGGVGEIGIHHGRLFLILFLALRPEERAFAIDIFDDQDLNEDGSGRGHKATFLRHLAAVQGDPRRISILERDSTTVNAEEVLSATGPVRFMSVDGGHTQRITHSDLALADAVLTEDGILVLDDVYNERWPGVAAAAFSYVAQPEVTLRPFAVTPNKTFFCKNAAMGVLYRDALAAGFARQFQGHTELFGHDCAILGRQTLTNRIKALSVVKNNANLYRRLSQVRHIFS